MVEQCSPNAASHLPGGFSEVELGGLGSGTWPHPADTARLPAVSMGIPKSNPSR